MNSVTAVAHAASAHPCNCGCSKCEAECCELDCLVQPRFFCGQMLTDQDLTALLDWVKGKSALTRYRDGWGIVCGLDVHCAATPGNSATIGVRAGYAIDCCGNDIIVCGDATLDLSTCIAPPTAACAGNSPAPIVPPANNNPQQFGPFQLPGAEVRAVDVMIHYKETQSDPKSGLARGGCSGTTACEYTRTHEDYELYCKLVDGCDDPSNKHAQDWYQAYKDGLSKLLDFLAKVEGEPDAQRRISRLLAWLRQYPPHSFCFLCDYLCDLQQTDPLPERWFEDVIFWIIQDWRNSYLLCRCEGCGPETAVRLARVWLWCRTDNLGKQQCKVLYINAYAPFRRPVARDCWPVPSDSVSLARFIWETIESSCGPLLQLGFSGFSTAPFEYSTLADLRGQLQNENIFVNCADRDQASKLVAYYREDHCGQTRIVYFGPAQAAQRAGIDVNALPADSPDLDLRKVSGIGDASTQRLKASGIHNLIQLAAATPQAVKDALSTMPPIAQPNEARCAQFIASAKAQINRLSTGT